MTAEDTRSKAREGREQPLPKSVTPYNTEVSRKREMLNTLIGEQVLQALGEPRNLLMVQVRPLWDGKYRVNIFVGADASHAKIPHSYFVVADSDGNILSASPTIHKHY